MHPILLESLKRLQDRLVQDERCVGMFLAGSMANGTADEWSDVDVVAVLRADDYPSMKREFRAICEADCGKLLVWLPEGEREQSVNYAFLFEVENRVHLYDFSICTTSLIGNSLWLRPGSILFDKTGLLASAIRLESVPTFKPGDLRHLINNWWVYTYLNGKYYKRRDVYKMLYVQDVIFQTHMKVLNAFNPAAEWHWWARDIHTLPLEKQAELIVYFGAAQPDDIGKALRTEMDLFSRDAQAACSQWDCEYPSELERGVREHLKLMGVTP